MSNNTKPYILLIGNAGVGKSSYIRKLYNLDFRETYTPTTGFVETHIPGLYNFIELSGQEPHNEYAEEVLARADRIYIMVSKTSKKSFESIPFWIQKYSHLHLNFTILINKSEAEASFDIEQTLYDYIRTSIQFINIHYISCKNGDVFIQ